MGKGWKGGRRLLDSGLHYNGPVTKFLSLRPGIEFFAKPEASFFMLGRFELWRYREVT